MNIAELPEEMLMEIFSYIILPYYARVCRTFNHVSYTMFRRIYPSLHTIPMGTCGDMDMYILVYCSRFRNERYGKCIGHIPKVEFTNTLTILASKLFYSRDGDVLHHLDVSEHRLSTRDINFLIRCTPIGRDTLRNLLISICERKCPSIV